MTSDLIKVSLALLSAVFVLGCQDQGPVGPDGLVPQFDKADSGAPCPVTRDAKGHCHGDGGSELATVTLAGGMTMATLGADGKNDDLNVSLAVFFDHDILMSFPVENVCVKTTGEGGSHDGEMSADEIAYLALQLTNNTVTSGSFILKVDKTALTGHIKVGYEGEFTDEAGNTHSLNLLINVGSESPVERVQDVDVFLFKGPIKVAADGWDGFRGKKGRRAIKCGDASDNMVTATVTPPSA